MRVLSITHGPSVQGGVFEETVERAGHRLERWSVPLVAAPALEPVSCAFDGLLEDAALDRRAVRDRQDAHLATLCRGVPL